MNFLKAPGMFALRRHSTFGLCLHIRRHLAAFVRCMLHLLLRFVGVHAHDFLRLGREIFCFRVSAGARQR